MKILLEWVGIENSAELIDTILYHVSSNDLDCSIEVMGNCGRITAIEDESKNINIGEVWQDK